MQYMAKDKSIYSCIFFAIAFLIYGTYIYYDYKNQGNWWREDFGKKKQDEIAKVLPNALLLGGSNLVYSLSASQLSDLTEYSWYNLGLSSEAFNDRNYWDFVSSTLNDKQRLDVELVVYSGINFLSVGHTSSRSNDTSDAWGNRKLSWLPNAPLALRFKNILTGVNAFRGYPLPITRGDFDFDKMNCDPNYQEAFEREMDWEQIQSWLDSQVSIISEKFSNAAVVIVIPSEFYGKMYDRNIDKSYAMKLQSFIELKYGSNVSFLAQPPYKEKSMTCDARHHANSVGRVWRTDNLVKFLESQINYK